ncbi:unnamed protein product [Candidula unifasciata]|uniref:MYND-type domain-containing protein n=1 Tax=Candidula unifasciata TaxID=100452 RepID=A0A8S3YTP2_9EUPU|nr:unnamed protein product [Candidula unifasciata]
MDEAEVKKWMAIKELQDRNRCIKCKRPLDEFVVCERCLEFKYCSIQCLEDNRNDHLRFCNVIGLLKGRLTRLTDEEGERMEKLQEKARLLNEDGTLRIPPKEVLKEGGNSSEKDGNDKMQADAEKIKPRKNKHSKTEQKEKASEDKPVKPLITSGQFGGAAKVGQKIQSGESFGEGWWSQRKTEPRTDETATDPNSTSSGDKPKNIKEEYDAPYLPTAASAEVILEKAVSGLEIVKYDPKQAGERSDRAKSSLTLGKCSFCGIEGPVLKCSRCKIANYCDKNCQKADYKKHSNICNMVLGSRCHVMVEIIDEHPHPFRFGAIVKDAMGQTTQVLFYTDTPYYNHRMGGMFGWSVPIPLSRCIKPGNFLLILEAHWHHFLDGTRGIRVDDTDEVFFVFMDKEV